VFLNLRNRDKSSSVIPPNEVADTINLGDSNNALTADNPLGYELSPSNPSFAAKIAAARRGMEKYHNALIELAE
jgi:hypothetical protein